MEEKRRTEKSIIYLVLIEKGKLKKINDTKVKRDHEVGRDHCLVKVQIV